MLREKAIPFELRCEVSNADTIAAIREADEMEKHPELAKTYSSVDELMEELLK